MCVTSMRHVTWTLSLAGFHTTAEPPVVGLIYGRTIIPCCKHCTFVYATSVDKQLVSCNDISDGLRTEHLANMQAASIMFMLASSQAGRGVVKVSSSHACCTT